MSFLHDHGKGCGDQWDEIQAKQQASLSGWDLHPRRYWEGISRLLLGQEGVQLGVVGWVERYPKIAGPWTVDVLFLWAYHANFPSPQKTEGALLTLEVLLRHCWWST